MSGMDDDMQDDGDQQQQQRPRVVLSTKGASAAAAGGSQSQSQSSSGGRAPRSVVKTKGRGFSNKFGADESNSDRYAGKAGEFESLEVDEGGAEAQKSVEGWLIMVTGLQEETNEDDVYELFADHGEIKQLHLNLDRRTGYVKGYCLIQMRAYKEGLSAIQTLNGHVLHDKPLTVDWAFKPAATNTRQPRRGGGGRQSGGGGGGGGGGRNFSSGGRGQQQEQTQAQSTGGRGAVHQ